MLVSFALGAEFFLRHLTQNPKRESVDYRLRWVPNENFLRWPCTFHFFVCRFHLRWVANANPISSGIWALDFYTFSSHKCPHTNLHLSIIMRNNIKVE